MVGGNQYCLGLLGSDGDGRSVSIRIASPRLPCLSPRSPLFSPVPPGTRALDSAPQMAVSPSSTLLLAVMQCPLNAERVVACAARSPFSGCPLRRPPVARDETHCVHKHTRRVYGSNSALAHKRQRMAQCTRQYRRSHARVINTQGRLDTMVDATASNATARRGPATQLHGGGMQQGAPAASTRIGTQECNRSTNTRRYRGTRNRISLRHALG